MKTKTKAKKAVEITEGLGEFATAHKGQMRFFKMSPPLDGNKYVCVSAVSGPFATETYIFPADKTGEVTGWGELEGSMKGVVDHAAALSNAGYTIHA